MQTESAENGTTAATAVTAATAPVTVDFHDKYLTVCRRRNARPLAAVCKGRAQAVLDVCADRVRLDEWLHVLRALRDDQRLAAVAIRLRKRRTMVLDHYDTEKKCRRRQRNATEQPEICTKFTFTRTVRTIAQLLEHNTSLTALALEGLPLAGSRYVERLAHGLTQHAGQQLRSLSLARCGLGDDGCRRLCISVRQLACVERVDLSECDLGAAGAAAVAAMLSFQKIHRFSEAWQQSLRYRSVDPDQQAGLKYVKLSDNPLIGDAGLRSLLTVLAEDVWIKSMQMQNCGLGGGNTGNNRDDTSNENGAEALLACLHANKTLVVFDVCRNPNISEAQMQQIRAQFVVESPLELDDRHRPYRSSADRGGRGGDDNGHPNNQKHQMAKFENGRLSERISFLQQQLQIESMVRQQAEQLNGQLQLQLEAQQKAQAQVPEGFLLVPTKQLNELVLEVEEIRGMSTTSSHSTSLLTQITNPNYTQSAVAAVLNKRLLHKSPSEAAYRPHVHFATRPSLSESHVQLRLPEQATHADAMQYVESNIGDFHHNQPQQQQPYSAKILNGSPTAFFEADEDDLSDSEDEHLLN